MASSGGSSNLRGGILTRGGIREEFLVKEESPNREIMYLVHYTYQMKYQYTQL